MFATFKADFGNYDIVYFHAEGPCAMLWLTKLFGKKCITKIHGEIDIMVLSEIYACNYGIFA